MCLSIFSVFFSRRIKEHFQNLEDNLEQVSSNIRLRKVDIFQKKINFLPLIKYLTLVQFFKYINWTKNRKYLHENSNLHFQERGMNNLCKQIVKCQNAKTSMIKSFMQNANDIIKKDFVVTSSNFEEKIIKYLFKFCNKYLARNWFGSERFWSPEWASTLSSSSSPVTQSGRPESSNFMCKDYKYHFIWNQSLCNFPI